MNRAEETVRRIDRFQQRHPVVGFPFGVIQKFGNDRAGALATRIAYHGLFSLFPLLLLLTTILGFVLGGHPDLRAKILDSALADFPIIGTQLKETAHPLRGNGLALAVGIVGTAYGAFGVGQSAQAAMNSVWNVPYVEWPSFVARRLRAIAAVVVCGTAAIVSGLLSAGAGSAPGGTLGVATAHAASVLVTLVMFIVAFMLLTAAPLGWRDVWLGAVLATAFWQGLQAVATWYMHRTVSHATDTYGFFAIVIALLSFLYLGAQLTLLAAEVNVVRRYQLWPRSMTQPPLTEGDRRTFRRLADMAARRPEYEVTTRMLPAADEDPLDEIDRGDGADGGDDSDGSAGDDGPGDRGDGDRGGGDDGGVGRDRCRGRGEDAGADTGMRARS